MPTQRNGKSATTAANAAATNGAGRGSLVIVESPAKAKTIGKYLGARLHREGLDGPRPRPAEEHARASRSSTTSRRSTSSRGTRSRSVKELKEQRRSRRARSILATDPDREGEAIAWHLVAGDRARRQAGPAGSSSTRSRPTPSREAMAHPRDDRHGSRRRPAGAARARPAGRLRASARCSGRRSSAGSRPAACSRPRCGSWSSASARSRPSCRSSTGRSRPSWPSGPARRGRRATSSRRRCTGSTARRPS